MLDLFDRYPLVRLLLTGGLLVVYLLRTLLGTLLGLLLLSALLYLSSPFLFSIKPWTHYQLLIWFEELGIEAKVGVASSIVTILGFFIAMYTAMRSWREQLAAATRFAAGERIDQVVGEASSIILWLQLHIQAHVGIPAPENNRGIQVPRTFASPHVSMNATEYREKCWRLLDLEQEISGLLSRYAVPLFGVTMFPRSLQVIQKEIGTVTALIRAEGSAEEQESQESRRNGQHPSSGVTVSKFVNVCQSALSSIAVERGAFNGSIHGLLLELNLITVPRMLRMLR